MGYKILILILGYFLIMLLMAVPITSKKNKVKKLQEAVNKLKQDFQELQNENEELKNNVSILNTDLSIHEGKIEYLENYKGKLS